MLTIDLLNQALREGKFDDFLLGVGDYMIQNRDGYATDRSMVMHSGIYKKYLEDPKIKEIFEHSLKEFLKGDEFHLLTSFDYVRIQMTSEVNNVAPFELDKSVYEEVRKAIIERAEELKQYRNNEFGGRLPEGAYQYITNVNNILSETFGAKLL